MSPALNRILEDALKEADQFKDEYVSTEHLLIALANAKGEDGRAGTQVAGSHQGRHPEGAGFHPRQSEDHGSESGRKVSGAAALFARPYRTRAQRASWIR